MLQSDREFVDRELMRAHIYVRDAKDFVTTGDVSAAENAARAAFNALQGVIAQLVAISERPKA